MFVKITFGSISKRKYSEKTLDEIIVFMGALQNAGFVFGDEVSGIENEVITCYVKCYADFTLEEASGDEYVKSDLKKMKKLFGQLPILEFHKFMNKKPSVKSKNKLILLFTNFLDRASPLVNPTTGKAIPLFQLPLSYDTKMGLLHWQAMYRSADTMFMLGSGKIERINYKFITEQQSELMIAARELAQLVESETKIPTYTYFHRYYAFDSDQDENFPCPICGNPWESSEKLKTKVPYVEKVCIDCRIMSCIGVSQEGKRKAIIGTK